MTIDFSKIFEGATTVAELDNRYREAFVANDCSQDRDAYWKLSDAHRRAHEMLSLGTRMTQVIEDDPNPLSARRLRNFAAEQGISVAKRGRLPQSLVDAYLEAHPTLSPIADS